jgi:hypothetical protein
MAEGEVVLNVVDIVHVMFQAPDLDVMENFLLHFGMVVAVRTESALYMRGHGTNHYVHVTYKGAEPKFLGMAFQVGSMKELETLSKREGVPIKESQEPGGGLRVGLRDPEGHRVDALYGQKNHDPLPLSEKNVAVHQWNERNRDAAHTKEDFQRIRNVKVSFFLSLFPSLSLTPLGGLEG